MFTRKTSVRMPLVYYFAVSSMIVPSHSYLNYTEISLELHFNGRKVGIIINT